MNWPARMTSPQQLKTPVKDLGGNAKACAIGVSDPGSLLRIIEQPETPVDLLRNALRLNGLAVLNQECKDFVLDCAPVSANGENDAMAERPATTGNLQRSAATKQISRRRNAAHRR